MGSSVPGRHERTFTGCITAEKVLGVMVLVFLEISGIKVASPAAQEAAWVWFKAVDTGSALSNRGCAGVNCCRWGSSRRGSLR